MPQAPVRARLPRLPDTLAEQRGTRHPHRGTGRQEDQYRGAWAASRCHRQPPREGAEDRHDWAPPTAQVSPGHTRGLRLQTTYGTPLPPPGLATLLRWSCFKLFQQASITEASPAP